MVTLKEIMTADPVTVGPEATLREVADLLTAAGISGVPVVGDSGDVMGVVSASDILTFTATLPGVPVQRPEFSEWDDLPRTEEEETPPEYFADFWPDAGADVVARMGEVASPEWDVLDEHTADEIMSRKLETVEQSVDVCTAARRMVEAKIHRLLVVNGDLLIGVVTTTDFVKAIASGALKL